MKENERVERNCLDYKAGHLENERYKNSTDDWLRKPSPELNRKKK